MQRIVGLVILFLCLIATLSIRGEEPFKLGDKAPDWAALPGTDDKLYSLADFKDRDALVIVFTCNSCPYAQDYEERIIAFCKKYCGAEQKTALIAINANKVKDDQPEEMKKRAKAQGFNFPYVWDETQQTARSYDAIWTPEFYVFNRDRKLIYRGALDDNTNAKLAKVNYLAEAVEAILAGGVPKTQETAAVGCQVRYERKRREKK